MVLLCTTSESSRYSGCNADSGNLLSASLLEAYSFKLLLSLSSFCQIILCSLIDMKKTDKANKANVRTDKVKKMAHLKKASFLLMFEEKHWLCQLLDKVSVSSAQMRKKQKTCLTSSFDDSQ